MRLHATKCKTWLFIGFLLLGGLFHYFDPTENLFLNSFLFCGRFTIFAGLILFWIQSVRSRLLPTRVRTYIFSAGLMMLCLLTVQVFNNRIVGDAVDAQEINRFSRYVYWIPQAMNPALFLMSCIRIYRGGQDKKGWNERLLMIPAVFLSLMVLTNDLHYLVYYPKAGFSELTIVTGKYSQGLGFYLLYAWMILTFITGLILLFRKTGRRPAKGIALLTGVTLTWLFMLLMNMLVWDWLHVHQPYSTQEINIFGMLGIFEICIRNHLIPSNENHIGFFEQLGRPVMITDRNLAPVYRTNRAVDARREVLEASLAQPVYPQEDIRLSGMEIRAGYAFWTEDETELHREARRLEEANEILREENSLVQAENELKEKKARLDAQKQVYDRIAAALYPRQKRIAELLSGTEPESDYFSQVLAECCVLNAWCKRKSNLLLLDETALPRRNRELFLALQESARFLKCCDVDAAAVGEEMTDFALTDIHDLYDTFESVIEAWLPFMYRMTVSILQDGIRMAVDAGKDLAVPETILPVEKQISEDTVFLTIRKRNGGKAA